MIRLSLKVSLSAQVELHCIYSVYNKYHLPNFQVHTSLQTIAELRQLIN